MAKILVSLHSASAQQIIAGTKKYEYRRIRPKQAVTSMVIYVTEPVGMVVAEAEVLQCIEGTLEELWQMTTAQTEQSRQEVWSYFAGRETGCALQLGTVTLFQPPKGCRNMEWKNRPVLFGICRNHKIRTV